MQGYAMSKGTAGEADVVHRRQRYVIATRWMELERLRKNANGELGRPRLRVLFEEAIGRTGDGRAIRAECSVG